MKLSLQVIYDGKKNEDSISENDTKKSWSSLFLVTETSDSFLTY